MAEKHDSGFLKSAFKTAVIGAGLFFVTGVFDFAWAHENAGGQALINALNPIIQGFYDWTGITDASLWLAEAVTNTMGGAASQNAQAYGAAALDIYNNW